MSAPRILLNALSMSEGGGRSYITNLLRELARDDRGLRISVLALPGQLDGMELSGVEVRSVALPQALGAARVPLRVLYEQTLLAVAARDYDALYCVADIAPAVAWTPTVVLLRNLNIYDRRFYDDRRTRTLARLAAVGTRRAARVLFPSQAAADLIREHLFVEDAKVRVVHYGIDLGAFEDGPPVASERPFLLLPAALERHKNVELLIQGLGLCADPELELWLAGRSLLDPTHQEKLWSLADAHGVRSRVKALGAVPYAKLLAYYRGARALALPSFIETFGHPVLEAMAAGTQLVLSDIPTFREIAADAALYFDPRSPEDFARCVDRLTEDPAGCEERRQRAAERLPSFSWRESVDALCRILDEVATGAH